MPHEFPVEELLECTRCGEVLPYGLMTFLDDGQILCPDCYEEMIVAEDESVDKKDDSPSEEPLTDFASLMQNISIATETADSWSRRLSFIRQLPNDLRNEFIGSIHSGIDPFIDRLLMNKTEGLTIRDFNAIDVETANGCPSSICSIGVVFVRDGKIVDRFYSLVHPEPDYYAYACQRVHGLEPADTDRAPNFWNVWNKIRNRIQKVFRQVSPESSVADCDPGLRVRSASSSPCSVRCRSLCGDSTEDCAVDGNTMNKE